MFGSLEITESIDPASHSVDTPPLRFRISPEAFFQVNTAQAAALYAKALDACELAGDEVLWDVYCGSGTISGFLACKARAVLGVESSEASVRDAWANAASNRDMASPPLAGRLCFAAGEAEKLLPAILGDPGALAETLRRQARLRQAAAGYAGAPSPELVRLLSETKPDAVVLDPPTKGAKSEALQAILAAKPKRIVYVSCNPATLARDLHILVSQGAYEIRSLQPIDLFPQTAHVETVVSLYEK